MVNVSKYAQCMEYVPTFIPKMIQICRYKHSIYVAHTGIQWSVQPNSGRKNKTCQGLLIPIAWMSLLWVLLSFRSSHQPKIWESTYRVMKLLYHAVPPILWIHRDIVCWRWCCAPEGIIENHKSIFHMEWDLGAYCNMSHAFQDAANSSGAQAKSNQHGRSLWRFTLIPFWQSGLMWF